MQVIGHFGLKVGGTSDATMVLEASTVALGPEMAASLQEKAGEMAGRGQSNPLLSQLL